MYKIRINGVVQGIGFRPFIYWIAHELRLKGTVVNTSMGVEIEVAGTQKEVDQLLKRIRRYAPLSAEIKEIDVQKIRKAAKFTAFKIKKSIHRSGSTLVAPDLAMCNSCKEELFDRKDHRNNYAFINCTNCGPRYSVIEKMPYDRPMTTMKKFKMCEYCWKEYIDPLNRRFHAQPVACKDCGPELKLLNSSFEPVMGDPVNKTRELLLKGEIVGIKGIGGFHIACDPAQDKTIQLLRKRKNRPRKPFAMMVKPEMLGCFVKYTKSDLNLLNSSRAPIVLLEKKCRNVVLDSVAPDNLYVGIMFPYAPVHHLLLDNDLSCLIMTSGNKKDEPVAVEEKELEGLCDYYLTNNRPIKNRSDDSVLIPLNLKKTGNIILRRSRGYVPVPLALNSRVIPTIGCGGELKSAFSLSEGHNHFLSPYLGNSGNLSTMKNFEETYALYKKWFNIRPELAACDLHPDYFSSKFAGTLNLPLVKVQHHFAHVLSVMAEHNLKGPVIGVAYDGTGYGTDGNIWGGEILLVDYKEFERLYYLKYMPLPGGDSATRYPRRTALAYLQYIGEDISILKNFPDKEKEIISKQVKNNYNIILTSSMGRLFDCVGGLLGLVSEISFEAQAPILLESTAGKNIRLSGEAYSYSVEDNMINVSTVLNGIVMDIKRKKSPLYISGKFHSTIIRFTVDCIRRVNKETGIKEVVLSGGVMQNQILMRNLYRELIEHKFKPYIPKSIPLNDGGISIGQVLHANRQGLFS